MRALRLALIVALVVPLLAACSVSPAARKPPVVNVAILTYPGGGAPPQVLSLYKAAMEVNRSAGGEFDLRVTTVSPTPQQYDPRSGPMREQPTITALEQALGQEPPPDLVLFTSTTEFGSALGKELLQSLTPYLKSERAVKSEDYFPGALEALTDGGQLYGLPIAVAPTVLQYDKRAFDAAGVESPTGDWDWTGFVNVAKAVTKVTGDPQKDQWGINILGLNGLIAMIWQNGGDILSRDGKRALIAEPAAVEAIKFYRDLIYTYKVAPPPFKPGSGAQAPMPAKPMIAVGPGEVPPIFGPSGRVAMQVMQGFGGVYSYSGFGPGAAGGDRPLKVVEMPKGKARATVLDVQTVLGLTSRATNGRLAYRALGALATEMQKELTVPASRTAAKNLRQINPNMTEEEVRVIVNSLEYARALPLLSQQRFMRAFYEKLLTPLQQQESKPVEELARDAADAIEQALNEDPNAAPPPPPAIAAPVGARP